MEEIRGLIREHGHETPVVAKIEKFEAIDQIDAILPLCDGVMVARGDLGVEMPAEEVPLLQKELIRKANSLGIPIITATQMLDSMASSPRPTRAEVSDVANAILDGTDAVMLSNETAVGDFPVEAVQTMATIARRIEKDYPERSIDSHLPSTIPNALSGAVSTIASQLNAAAIIPLTKTGATAHNVSKFRPAAPILAVTPDKSVACRLQACLGGDTPRGARRARYNCHVHYRHAESQRPQPFEGRRFGGPNRWYPFRGLRFHRPGEGRCCDLGRRLQFLLGPKRDGPSDEVN
jgi:pyruvate kinase